MSRDDNPFGDVDDEIANRGGVLQGQAYAARERIDEKPNGNGEGFDFTVNCTNCSGRYVVTIGWPELIVASCGATPLDADSQRPWAFKEGFLYPPIGCSCGTPLSVPITPDKAQRMIKTGIRMNVLNPQTAEQARLHTLQQMQRMRRG